MRSGLCNCEIYECCPKCNPEKHAELCRRQDIEAEEHFRRTEARLGKSPPDPDDPLVKEVEKVFAEYWDMSTNFLARAIIVWHHGKRFQELTARADRGDKLADNPEQQP